MQCVGNLFGNMSYERCCSLLALPLPHTDTALYCRRAADGFCESGKVLFPNAWDASIQAKYRALATHAQASTTEQPAVPLPQIGSNLLGTMRKAPSGKCWMHGTARVAKLTHMYTWIYYVAPHSLFNIVEKGYRVSCTLSPTQQQLTTAAAL